MSWFSSWWSSPKDSTAPTLEQCAMYKESLEFVISNLKFSLIHHNARVDGTMNNAWKQEQEMLQFQLAILQKYPENVRHIRRIQEELKQLEKTMTATDDPKEMKRLHGMCDMHTQFVRTLESMVPLLKQKCPTLDWTQPTEALIKHPKTPKAIQATQPAETLNNSVK